MISIGMMIAQRKNFLPNKMEYYSVVTSFRFVYKQEYGMLEVYKLRQKRKSYTTLKEIECRRCDI